MEPKTIAQWKKLIETQIALSDYGENTLSLNTLYYDFYLFVTRGEEA
jgi:hypothetical protein